VCRKELLSIGDFIKNHDMRVSMHPDQFTLINSPNEAVLTQSRSELTYHAYFLDSMNLGYDAKIQIHIGGVYGDKKAATSRFIKNYKRLPPTVKNRLVIENDDRLYSLKDCLGIHHATGIPVLLDIFHHQCLNNGETLREAFSLTAPTWQEQDGTPIVDYSLQQEGARKGKHRESINSSDFKSFLKAAHGFSFDLMLEIKDKEKSALKALDILKQGE
jgi:UV DNA damage endonuclease